MVVRAIEELYSSVHVCILRTQLCKDERFDETLDLTDDDLFLFF